VWAKSDPAGAMMMAMAVPSDALPTDADALRALLVAERARHAAEMAEVRAATEEEIARLRQIIKQLQRHRFGRRSEQLDPDQLNLALEDLEQALAALELEPAKAEATRKRLRVPRRVNRGRLPAGLPREEVVVDLADKACPCCGGPLHAIGEDVSERLDIIPARFRVLVTRRPKYACRSCQEGVVQAPAPARIVDAGLPTEALIATCWRRNMPITCRSTGKPRSMPARASCWIARRWPTGWAGRPGTSSPFMSDCSPG
jgi:transposase